MPEEIGVSGHGLSDHARCRESCKDGDHRRRKAPTGQDQRHGQNRPQLPSLKTVAQVTTPIVGIKHLLADLHLQAFQSPGGSDRIEAHCVAGIARWQLHQNSTATGVSREF